MKGLDVNLAIWGMFMNTTLRSAVHLGKDYGAFLRYVKSHLWKTAGQLFRDTEKLVRGQTETTGISIINFQGLGGYRQAYCTGRTYQHSTAKDYVISDSVLCLGKMGDNAVESWKRQIQWYSDNNYFNELNRIDGQPMEFEWKIFPGLTKMGILNQIQQMMGDYSVNLNTSTTGSSSCQCTMTLCGMQKEMMNYVKTIQRQLNSMLVDSFAVIGLSWGIDLKRSGAELTIKNQMDLGTELQRECY